MNYSEAQAQVNDIKNIGEPPKGLIDKLSFIGDAIGFFFSGIFFSLSSIPFWINTILFMPLGITLIWAIIEVIAIAIP